MTDQFVCIECNTQGEGAVYGYGFGPICKKCAFLLAEPVPALAPQQTQYEPLNEAELARYEELLTKWQGVPYYETELKRLIATIRARDEEIVRLRAIERHYARHRDGCRYMKECTCGYAAARKALKGTQAKEERRLPTIEEMTGRYPDLTGDMTTEEYLRDIRGG